MASEETTKPTGSAFEAEMRALQPILNQFMTSYRGKPPEMADETWLAEQLGKELPEASEQEIRHMSSDIQKRIRQYEMDRADLDRACARGESKSAWFAKRMTEAAAGGSTAQYGAYLAEIDRTLAENNELLLQAITRKDGNISGNQNLDGFIAEQLHANSFNRQAALKRSHYRAHVAVPEGKYPKNSVDIAITDTSSGTKRMVKRYQSKYGKDAPSTAQYLKNGDYRNQQALVPKNQKRDVRSRMTGNKTITDHIESPDGITSKPVTKEQVKKIQERVQDGKQPPQDSWNSFTNKELLQNLGKEAALAGVGAAAISEGVFLAQKLCKGEEIKGDEALRVALESGADAGVKAAATGALKVASEKGLISALPKGTPAGIIATFATVGIEDAKVLKRYADGELTGTQAVDHLGRTTVTTTYGMATAAIGSEVGATLGSVVPVVGTTIGMFVGGAVGYMAGASYGNAIYEGAKRIVRTARKAVQQMASAIHAAGEAIAHAAQSIRSFLFS